MQASHAQENSHPKGFQLGYKDGEDFMFLFDLISHTCGIESTLRVLTHSDMDFFEMFKPNLNEDQLALEEDRLRVRLDFHAHLLISILKSSTFYILTFQLVAFRC